MAGMKSSNLWGGIILFLFLLRLCVNTANALSGSGIEADPWRIQSLTDFDDFASDANYWDDYTRLETDVNLAGRVYERAVIARDVNDDKWRFQGTAFTGVLDGNDHKIIDLTIDDGGAGNNYLGLFGYINNIDGGEVRNLGLEGGSVSGNQFVGGLVGANRPGVAITNCYSTGDVSGTGEVGGLVGGNNHGSVSDCYSTGNVTGEEKVGGLVGYNFFSSISNSYSTGDVSGVTEVGGLVGSSDASITNCYSTGDVNGIDNVGGLVGLNFGSISTSFWDTDTQIHGVTDSIGDNQGTTTNVEGLPTFQLHQQSTFTNWDFINVWNIGENQTYPYLRTVPAGDINKDKTVNFLDVCIIADQWCNEQ